MDSFCELSENSSFETCCFNILELLEGIFNPVLFNSFKFKYLINNENLTRFDNISVVIFTADSPLVPCILSSFNVEPTGVEKLFCVDSNLTWEHSINVTSRPVNSNTKGPEDAATRNFPNSIQADMDFSHCLSPSCYIDQVFTKCLSILTKGPWFTFALIEIGGGASSASLNKGIENWCDSTFATCTRISNRFHHPRRLY